MGVMMRLWRSLFLGRMGRVVEVLEVVVLGIAMLAFLLLNCVFVSSRDSKRNI